MAIEDLADEGAQGALNPPPPPAFCRFFFEGSDKLNEQIVKCRGKART